jgi:hypothetical protein
MNPKQRSKMREEIRKLKLAKGCVKCGYKANADGLTFDHREERLKLFNIAEFGTRSVTEVRAEIAKCDVRCGTCHLIRTARRNRKRNTILLEIEVPEEDLDPKDPVVRADVRRPAS